MKLGKKSYRQKATALTITDVLVRTGVLVALLLAVFPASVSPLSFIGTPAAHASFSCANPTLSLSACLQLNGTVTGLPSLNTGDLRLTNTGTGGTGSTAFFTTPMDVTTPFTTSFTFDIEPAQAANATQYTGNVGDGFAFIIQNDPAGATALSGSGGGFGYSYCSSVLPATPLCTGIGNSIAIEFDPYSNWQINDPYPGQGPNGTPDPTKACEHVAILENGDLSKELAYTCVPVSGAARTASVHYSADSANPSLSVWIGGQQVLNYPVNLVSVVGSSGYMGFGGSTGAFTATQDITNWRFQRTPNLVSDGSFEVPNVDVGGQGGQGFFSGTPSLMPTPGWSVCNSSNMEIDNQTLGAAEDGNQLVELNGDGPAALCQDISTIPGQTYRFSFYYAGRPGYDATVNAMDVQWGSSAVDHIAVDATNDGGNNWQQYTYAVTASSSTTTLRFTDTGAAQTGFCFCGSLLDNVQVIQSTPSFALGQSGRSTWGGTSANPLDISGSAVPGSTVSVHGGTNCSSSTLATATAGTDGTWSVSLSNLAPGPLSLAADALVGNTTSLCSGSISATVDRTVPTTTVTFPALGTNTQYINGPSWTAGCGTPSVDDICGTASDSGGSGVAAVFVAVENANGNFWNGADFTSTGAWVKATGTTNWSLSLPRPVDGPYTVAAAAIDSAGNTPPIFSMSVAGICDPTGTGGHLSLNGGQLSINGGVCVADGTSGGNPVSGQLSLNGGQLSINGGGLTGGQLSLNGGQLSLIGGTCTVRDNSGTTGTLTITGGTLNSSGGQLSLNGGQLSINGGQLSLNGGQLSLNGGLQVPTGGQVALNGGNCTLTASGSSGTLTLNGGQLSSGSGQLSLNGGQLSINGGQLSINGGQLSLNGGQLSINGGAGGNAGNVVIDTVAPYVSFFEINGMQQSGSMNIDPRATLNINFDESMLASTVNTSTVTVTPATGAAFNGTITCNSGCFVANVAGFRPSTTYTVTVTSKATDLAGNGLISKTIEGDGVLFTYSNTFVFTTAAASPLNTNLAGDADHDGIPDGWDGPSTPAPVFTINGAQTSTTAWGFNPNRRDLCLVESYMSGRAANGQSYSQAISQAANQAIVNAFANAPNGGVHVVIFEGDAAHSAGLPSGYSGPYPGGQIPMTDPLGDASTGSFNWGAVAPGTNQSFDSIRTQYFVPTGLAQFCHFAVIAHTLGGSGSSGASRGIQASDLLISLGGTIAGAGVGTQQEQAGTVMHELGHNLGLHHGGGPTLTDLDVNYKPDYMSVMNYFFQFTGVPGGSTPNGLDYSHGTLTSPLNENSLLDSAGLGSGASGFGTRYFCPRSSTSTFVADASRTINWSCTSPSSTTAHVADINGDGTNSSLSDYNDWANLHFDGGNIGEGAIPPAPTFTDIDISGGFDPSTGNPILTQPNGAPLFDSASAIEGTMGLYGWTGFFPPLDPDSMGTVINSGKAGKTYPVKFQLLDQTGQYISSLSAVTSIAYAPSSACSGSSSDPIDYTATDSVSGLRYESGANQFIYNWASPSKAGCYLLKISLADNSARLALFSLK